MKQTNENMHVRGLRPLNAADRDYFDAINECTIQYLKQSPKAAPGDLAILPLTVMALTRYINSMKNCIPSLIVTGVPAGCCGCG